jgi:hypothetical protein
MAHNTKTLAMVGRRFAGGPAEVLAPSNRVSAGMVQMAEERDARRAYDDAIAALVAAHDDLQRAHDAHEITYAARESRWHQLTAALWDEARALAKGVR